MRLGANRTEADKALPVVSPPSSVFSSDFAVERPSPSEFSELLKRLGDAHNREVRFLSETIMLLRGGSTSQSLKKIRSSKLNCSELVSAAIQALDQDSDGEIESSQLTTHKV